MDFIQEVAVLFNQFMLFVQVADEDDNNIIETVILRRRQDILRQLLQRQRLILHRIHANRTIYYTAYVGTWFATYPEIQFKRDFRFTKRTFQLLVEIVSPQILTDYVYTGLPVTDKLMILIWCLANREAYRVLSRRFGMNQGTVHYVVMKTMKVIYNMADRFIVWPREERYLELSENFQIVDSLGDIDATEFEIRQPLNQLPSYTSRKCKTTIKLQIVSTHDLEIIDAAVGFPGSIGDARVLRLSPLSRALGAKLVRSNYHILGDTAYPLRQHLLVPFRNNHELEDHEMAFNRAFKRDRQVVERAFGLLKMKWRRVKFLDYFRMRYAHRTLLVCCCFHNFGLRHDNWLDDAPDVELDDEEDPDYEFDEERETEEGVQKRQFIAEQFIV